MQADPRFVDLEMNTTKLPRLQRRNATFYALPDDGIHYPPVNPALHFSGGDQVFQVTTPQGDGTHFMRYGAGIQPYDIQHGQREGFALNEWTTENRSVTFVRDRGV